MNFWKLGIKQRLFAVGVPLALLIGVSTAIAPGVASNGKTSDATLQLPRAGSFSAISSQTPLDVVDVTRSASYNHVASVSIPSSSLYQSMSVVDGALALSGSVMTFDHSDSQWKTACENVTVDPNTLTVGSPTTTCDGVPPGRRVGVSSGPIGAFYNDSKRINAVVRLVTSSATGSIATGPVVMSYGQYSDTSPVWIYGGGALWVYDCYTAHGGQVVELSATTGKVLDVASAPSLCRASVTADKDGFWIAQVEGPRGIYHVSPGAHVATLAYRTTKYFNWFYASGHDLWVDLADEPLASGSGEIWRLSGLSAKPTAHFNGVAVSIPRLITGSESTGLFVTKRTYADNTEVNGTEQYVAGTLKVLRINPDTGRSTVLATLTPPYVAGQAYSGSGLSLDLLGDTLFVFVPPAGSNGDALGPRGAVYRITNA